MEVTSSAVTTVQDRSTSRDVYRDTARSIILCMKSLNRIRMSLGSALGASLPWIRSSLIARRKSKRPSSKSRRQLRERRSLISSSRLRGRSLTGRERRKGLRRWGKRLRSRGSRRRDSARSNKPERRGIEKPLKRRLRRRDNERSKKRWGRISLLLKSKPNLTSLRLKSRQD